MGVHQQVHVPHAVTQLGVSEGVVHIALLIGLDGRQRTNRLAQNGELLHEHTRFTGLRGERRALDPHNITAVQQLLEHRVVGGLVLARTEFIAVEVDLDFAGGVLQLGKGGLAHDAAGKDAAGKADLDVLFEVRCQGSGVRVHGIGRRRVGVNAELAELLKAVQADAFLFGSDHGESVWRIPLRN